MNIRPARREDVARLHALVVELATYERAADRVTGTPDMLAEALFAEPAAAEALVAELDGETVGFALFFHTFSTWVARRGIWLEDLYVSPEHRRAGVGQALLAELARIAVQRGCGRLEWSALDWNQPALRFYAGLGADKLDDWIIHRLHGDALRRVAGDLNPG